jgi:hypothetical protein
VPTILARLDEMVGTALRAFAHPHMGIFESRLFRFGLSEVGWCEGGARSPRVAQRDDRVPGEDRLPKIYAAHCITSYPVGLVWSGPTFRMLAARSPEDETHLQNGCFARPMGGTVIIHPARTAAKRSAGAVVLFYAFIVASAGTSPVVR